MKKVIEDAIFQHKIMIKEIMESLVGRRYKNIRDIENLLREQTGEAVYLYPSVSELLPTQDYLIDGEIGNGNYFGLWYLKDNADQYYITEVQYNI